VKKLSQRQWKGTQSWNYESVVALTSNSGSQRVLKIDIKRDSYDVQSHARAYLFDGNTWNLLVYLPIEVTALKAHTHLSEQSGLMRAAARDEKTLIDESTAILEAHQP
jgi:hypothetical protein